jgi:1-acyl-sn-glycerol-3-phosphate acyltransferase
MSDAFYRTMRCLGRPAFWSSSRPVVIGEDNVPRTGACLVAATHQSPYDIPLMIRHTRRLVDFVSIVEVFRNPLVGWFYGSLNAFPLDRSRADPKTVRTIVDRLQRGRCIGIFPEGGFRKGQDSVIHSRKIRPGTGRIAHMTGAPVIPCVIINSTAYSRPASWLPFKHTRYGIIYGKPIDPAQNPQLIDTQLVEAYIALHAQLTKAMEKEPQMNADERR